jgi:hypothetical protein
MHVTCPAILVLVDLITLTEFDDEQTVCESVHCLISSNRLFNTLFSKPINISSLTVTNQIPHQILDSTYEYMIKWKFYAF